MAGAWLVALIRPDEKNNLSCVDGGAGPSVVIPRRVARQNRRHRDAQRESGSETKLMKCKRAPEAAGYPAGVCVKRRHAGNKRKINARTNTRPTANKIVLLARLTRYQESSPLWAERRRRGGGDGETEAGESREKINRWIFIKSDGGPWFPSETDEIGICPLSGRFNCKHQYVLFVV